MHDILWSVWLFVSYLHKMLAKKSISSSEQPLVEPTSKVEVFLRSMFPHVMEPWRCDFRAYAIVQSLKEGHVSADTVLNWIRDDQYVYAYMCPFGGTVLFFNLMLMCPHNEAMMDEAIDWILDYYPFVLEGYEGPLFDDPGFSNEAVLNVMIPNILEEIQSYGVSASEMFDPSVLTHRLEG